MASTGGNPFSWVSEELRRSIGGFFGGHLQRFKQLLRRSSPAISPSKHPPLENPLSPRIEQEVGAETVFALRGLNECTCRGENANCFKCSGTGLLGDDRQVCPLANALGRAKCTGPKHPFPLSTQAYPRPRRRRSQGKSKKSSAYQRAPVTIDTQRESTPRKCRGCGATIGKFLTDWAEHMKLCHPIMLDSLPEKGSGLGATRYGRDSESFYRSRRDATGRYRSAPVRDDHDDESWPT